MQRAYYSYIQIEKAMLQNYLKITLRNLWRNKSFSFINIFGLAVGLATAMLIWLWIQDELTFDNFYAKKDRLYMAWNRSLIDGKISCWDVTPSLLGPQLKKEYPEIVQTTRLNWTSPQLLRVGKKSLHVPGTFVDSTFFRMFDFDFLQGNPATALNQINHIVITESLARRLFGKANAMSKVIRVENRDNFVVNGIIQDLPKNTLFEFDFVLPWSYLQKIGQDYAYWGNNSYRTFVEIAPNTSLARINAKIKDITIRNSGEREQSEVFLHPLSRRRLYSKFENGKEAGGRIEYVRMFGIIAALVVVIACINFMNLATARSEKRVKEVGLRKVMGATRIDLVGQFLGESMLITFFALLLAVVFAELSLPWFNELTEKRLYIQFGNGFHWLAALVFLVVTGTLAGSYPAFYLSSFQPIQVLKGTFRSARTSLSARKLLVVVQFSFSIGLIISTIVIYHQIRHAQTRDRGYNQENLVFHFFMGDIDEKYDLIKAELLSQNIATAVCKTNAPISRAYSNTWGLEWKGKNPDERIIFDQLVCQEDFVKTMQVKLIEGRDIDVRKFKTDTAACIINESAARVMKLPNIVGEKINYEGVDYKVVGVFEDFIWGSPYEPHRPMFVRGDVWANVITMRLNDQQPTQQNLRKAEAVFKKFNPYYPFEYYFVDKDYNDKFKTENIVGTLATASSILTIIISCLGLYGLAAYTASQRTKEIGIRKVLGASVQNIVGLLSRGFLLLVLIAFVVASVASYFLMQRWLETYKYHVELSVWVFVGAGILAMLIALLTVSYQAIRASLTNPVEALRYE
ncbi:MAG: ABC transporter permease [Microscillaceae bacterium]